MSDIAKRLEQLDEWKLEDRNIERSFEFSSFKEAMRFVNEVARIAERHSHHPIITIIWKTVKVSSISFDVGRLTERDFQLAKAIDQLYLEKFEQNIPSIEDLNEEHGLLSEAEKKQQARKRTRGPYRKSSRAGLR